MGRCRRQCTVDYTTSYTRSLRMIPMLLATLIAKSYPIPHLNMGTLSK